MKEHTSAHKDAIGAMVLVQSVSSMIFRCFYWLVFFSNMKFSVDSSNIKNKYVWSGSFDKTIGVWNVLIAPITRRDEVCNY